MRIRNAEPTDIQSITDIYNEAVLAGGATADLEPRSLEQRTVWVESHSPRDRYPVVVVESTQGEVIGFGSLSRFHPRQAYDGVVELSYYVASSARGQGVGTALVSWLMDTAGDLGYRMATALIFASNRGSLALMTHFGFIEYGMLPNACYDGKKFLDMSYWYKEL